MLTLVLCRFAQTSAAALLAGTAALRLLAWGAGMERPSFWNRLAWISWGVLAAASIFQLALTAAEMSGQPLGQALSGDVLGMVLGGTSFGGVWKVRAWLLAGALVAQCLLKAAGRSVRAPLEVSSALLAAGVLATLVWAGHAHASDKHAWLLPVDTLHAIAAGCWPGGLLPLALLLGAARGNRGLVNPAVTVTRRFSRLSLAAVSILALSGLLNAFGLVGTFSALWASVYGRLILCKAALLAGLIGLGAVNRRLTRQELPRDAAQTLGRLWRNVAWECALAVCVLLATETLAMNAPPAAGG